MRNRWLSFTSALAAAAIVAAACGGTGTGTASATPAATAATKGEITIASNLPVSGADASDGLPRPGGCSRW